MLLKPLPTFALILAVLLIAACSTAPTPTPTSTPTPTPAPIVDLHPEWGKPFDMRLDNAAFIDAAGYRIDFKGIPNDSRCPPNGECLAPDIAIVRVEVRETAASAPQTHQLFFDTGTSTETIGGYAIQVLDLQPEVSEAPRPSDYVVTLLVTKPASELTLDPRMTSSAGSVQAGSEVTYTASADGSGLAQYTLMANSVVIGILRYDGTLVRGSQSPVFEMTSWTADANGASWTVKALGDGQFTMNVAVNGEVSIGGGAWAFAHGSASAPLTVVQ